MFPADAFVAGPLYYSSCRLLASERGAVSYPRSVLYISSVTLVAVSNVPFRAK